MKRLLITLSALVVSIPTIGFARSFNQDQHCWSTDDGSYFCFDEKTRAYSVRIPSSNPREPEDKIQHGTCGGTFVYDGMDWVLAAHYHYSFCKEKVYPLE